MDIVSTPKQFLVELLLLVLGCLLYVGGGLFYAAQLVIQGPLARHPITVRLTDFNPVSVEGVCAVAELIIANAVVVNEFARLRAQSLIRSAVTFLEGCIDESGSPF